MRELGSGRPGLGSVRCGEGGSSGRLGNHLSRRMWEAGIV